MSQIEKTDAICLKATKFRETSFIMTYLTRDFGKVKTLAKGIRKKKSRLLSACEPFVYQEIVFYHKPKRDIDLLADCHVKESFKGLRTDFEKICAASYMIELADEVTQVHHDHSDIFDLLLYSLSSLIDNPVDKLLRFYEIRILHLSGIFPNFEKCSICNRKITGPRIVFSVPHGGVICSHPDCRRRASYADEISAGCISSILFLKNNLAFDLDRFRLPTRVFDEMTRILRSFIVYHLQKELRSRRFMREMSEEFPILKV